MPKRRSPTSRPKYTYDDRDQLTGEFYVDQYIDSAGDFQSIASGGNASSFQPNLAYQYDANGNRRRRAEAALVNEWIFCVPLPCRQCFLAVACCLEAKP